MTIEKLFNWIKDNLKKTSLIIFGLFIGSIVLIQVPYWLGYKNVLIPSDYSAGDILSFSGTFLAALASSFLGLIALWQNIRFKKENDKAQEILLDINKRLLNVEIFKNRAIYKINHVSNIDINFNNDCSENKKLKINLGISKGTGFDFVGIPYNFVCFEEEVDEVINRLFGVKEIVEGINYSFARKKIFLTNDFESGNSFDLRVTLDDIEKIPWEKYKTTIIRMEFQNRDIYNRVHKDIFIYCFKVDNGPRKELIFKNFFIERIIEIK